LKLVCKERPWIMCLQETKLETIDEFVRVSLWGNLDFGYSFKPFVGASGGTLTLWDTSEVEVWDSRRLANVFITHGRFIQRGYAFFFVANVYTPCDSVGRQDLWTQLGNIINNNREGNWCVCGDFNVIRSSL